jgi:hypothetical protein
MDCTMGVPPMYPFREVDAVTRLSVPVSSFPFTASSRTNAPPGRPGPDGVNPASTMMPGHVAPLTTGAPPG